VRKLTSLGLRATCGLAVTTALALTPAVPAFAWSNGGQGSGPVGQMDGYGTHDWILDQGVRVAGSMAPGWTPPPLGCTPTTRT